MNVRKLFAAALLSAAFLLPIAAPASAQSALRVGATVTDTAGGTVGTITAISGGTVTVHTDRHDVPLPASSFTATDTQVLFGMTRDQLNAAVDQAQAAAQAAFAVGAQVRDRDGAVVGTVTALDQQSVTIQMEGAQIRVQRAALAGAPNGLVTGASLAELRAAATAGTPQSTN
jgi:preprotein translocase subunit YajC